MNTAVETQSTPITQGEVGTATRRSMMILGLFSLSWFVVNFISFTMVAVAPLDFLASRYTADQLRFLINLPTWSLLISGLSIGFGLVASVAMILRRQEAYFAYMLSLLMAIAHLFDAVGRGSMVVMSAGDAASSVMILLFSLFLFWASYDARRQGHLI